MENNKTDPRGYIKVWRKIWDNPVSSRAKYLSVFLFILSHANWKEKKAIVDNKTITIERGQWLGSILKIAEFFEDISYATVHYIVNWLKVDNIVDNKPTNKYTLFTVKNYDDYQPLDTRVDNKVITKLEQIDTTNKDNKDKKNILATAKKKKYSSLDDLTEKDFVEIAERYKVPPAFVKIQFEKMVNWIEAKGKRYKNYKRALMNWVLKEAESKVERSQNGKYRAVDARNVR